MDAIDSLALVSELFTWIGLISGAILLAIGLIIRATTGRWVKATGVIAAGEPNQGNLLRWFDRLGDVHQVDATTAECEGLLPGNDITVYFDARRPNRGRTDSPEHDGRGLIVTGGILLVIGIVASLTGLFLLFT